MAPLRVLTIQRVSAAERAQIAAVDPRVALSDAGGWFDGEIRATWPEFTARRYLPEGSEGRGTRAERDALLAEAEVILGGWPFPRDLRARAPRLRWFHQRPAGASNLRMGDLWGSEVIVTTSRGVGNTLAMAEYAIAGILHFAKALDVAAADRSTFSHRAYRPWGLAGRTLCVVGAGGIGREVGRLGAALGMRVVGTRGTPRADQPPPEGFAVLAGPEALDGLLAEADAVAVCCHWTEATTGLFDTARFAAMKPGAILVNVARGEIIDEAALTAALAADRLRGVVLDVYQGEFDHPPPAALWRHPKVLVTPHVSGAGDGARHGAITLFCANLRAFLDGRPLTNVVDWARGY